MATGPNGGEAGACTNGRQSGPSTQKPHDLLILLLKKLDTNAHSKSQEPEVEQVVGKARQGKAAATQTYSGLTPRMYM